MLRPIIRPQQPPDNRLRGFEIRPPYIRLPRAVESRKRILRRLVEVVRGVLGEGGEIPPWDWVVGRFQSRVLDFGQRMQVACAGGAVVVGEVYDGQEDEADGE